MNYVNYVNFTTKANSYVKFVVFLCMFCFLLNVFTTVENAIAEGTKNTDTVTKKTITKNFITKDGTIQINVPEIDLRNYDEKELDKAIAKTRIYPPYPDIWGYDVTDDMKSSDYGPNLSTMVSLEGDIVFDASLGNHTTMKLYFFGNKKVNIIGDDFGKYDNENKLQNSPKRVSYILFEDKLSIRSHCYGMYEVYSNDELKNCVMLRGRSDSDDPYAQVYPDDKDVEEFSIFVVEPYIEEDSNEKIFGIYRMPWNIRDLGDGTFLLYHSDYNIILRLDRNLKTKFKPKHMIDLGNGKILKTNFFILPYSTIKYFYDNVLTEYEGKQTYKLNWELLNYLYEEQEKGVAMY